MYITLAEYEERYPPISNFEWFCRQASRLMDKYTTGVDGARKLHVAFPSDEHAVESVKDCAAEIIAFLANIKCAQTAIDQGRGYIQTADGLRGKVISSVSSGNESISYAANSAPKSVVDSAIADPDARNKVIRNIIADHLSGVSDANGVNLLYMGIYPR